MSAARIPKAQTTCKPRATDYVSILSVLFEMFADCMFVVVLDWSTPGPTSFAKCVIMLFSECSVHSEIIEMARQSK